MMVAIRKNLTNFLAVIGLVLGLMIGGLVGWLMK